MSEELKKFFVRGVVASLALVYVLWRWPHWQGSVVEILLILGVLIAAGIFCALPLAAWLGEVVAQLFTPQRRISKPPSYIYDSPRLSVQKGEMEKAVQQYQQIIDNFPREMTAYLEMYPLLNKEGKKDLLIEAKEALSSRSWQRLQDEVKGA